MAGPSAPWPASPLVVAVMLACGWCAGARSSSWWWGASAWPPCCRPTPGPVPRPAPSAPFAGVVTLLTDPRPLGPGVVAEAVSGDRHHGAPRLRRERPPAAHPARRRAARRHGRSSPPSGRHAGRLRARHIVSVVDVTRVSFVGDGTALARSANRARRAPGARRPDHGPDRPQPVPRIRGRATTGPSRESSSTPSASVGLGISSAVSGQNVAFLLGRGRSRAATPPAPGPMGGDAGADRVVRRAHPVRAFGAARQRHGGPRRDRARLRPAGGPRSGLWASR